jgi:SAM-dependent methyltransferase
VPTRLLRRWFRRLVPRRAHPLLDAPVAQAPDDDRFAAAYRAELERRGESGDSFLAARYEEGRRWRAVLRHYTGAPRLRLLDLGAGNGAVELAFAADGFIAISVDALWNDAVRRLHAAVQAPVRRVVADAAALPFRADAFDAVLSLETIEHLPEPQASGRELARVTRAGAVLLLTTPPRWRFLLRPDPHFGIRALLLAPAAWQRRIAARRGFDEPHHYVDRIYGSVAQIARMLPGFRVPEVLSRSRAPKRFAWDAIVFRRE